MPKIRVAEIISDNRLKAYCPFHEDDNASLFIDLDRGAYCFAGCYKGDVVGLIAKLNQEDRFIARTHILDSFEFDVPSPFGKGFVFQNHVTDFTNASDWFQKRGFTFETALYWKVNFETTTLSVPIRDFNSTTVGVVTRNILASTHTPNTRRVFNDKYIYNKGFKKSQYLFGENFIDENVPIIVVEGILDVMWLWQLGFNSCGLMGVIVSSEQLVKLKKLKLYAAIFDDDAGGKVGAKNFSKVFPKVPVKTINVRELDKKKIMEELCQLSQD
jgi:DNA primase